MKKNISKIKDELATAFEKVTLKYVGTDMSEIATALLTLAKSMVVGVAEQTNDPDQLVADFCIDLTKEVARMKRPQIPTTPKPKKELN